MASPKETTKNILLDIGTDLIAQGGFNATGIEAVLKRAGVPKGSFYYYFCSKEDFGLQVIDRIAVASNARLDAELTDPSLSPLQRLYRYFSRSCESFAAGECRKGCLVGNLGQELADQSETFRRRIAEVFAGWEERIAACVIEAQAQGEIPGNFVPGELAAFLLAAYEGAVLQAKVRRDPAPVDTFLKFTFHRLLSGERGDAG